MKILEYIFGFLFSLFISFVGLTLILIILDLSFRCITSISLLDKYSYPFFKTIFNQ